jgi:hypothetical protein
VDGRKEIVDRAWNISWRLALIDWLERGVAGVPGSKTVHGKMHAPYLTNELIIGMCGRSGFRGCSSLFCLQRQRSSFQYYPPP